MTELRFPADLYSGFAIDAAVKVYEPFAKFELEKTDEAYIVTLESKGDQDETTIADELCNYALGATVEERDSRSE